MKVHTYLGIANLVSGSYLLWATKSLKVTRRVDGFPFCLLLYFCVAVFPLLPEISQASLACTSNFTKPFTWLLLLSVVCFGCRKFVAVSLSFCCLSSFLCSKVVRWSAAVTVVAVAVRRQSNL